MNPRADEFTVILLSDQMAINQVWLIERNNLYVVDSDGSADRDYPYRRLSRQEERRIFR